jgi:hypothetical protein
LAVSYNRRFGYFLIMRTESLIARSKGWPEIITH